jgi:hypothetical protein
MDGELRVKMNPTINETERSDANLRKKFAVSGFLSAAGSIASLTALVIVFIDKAATSMQVDPQLIIWRIALAVLCLMVIGTIIIIVYDIVSVTLSNDKLGNRLKTFRIFVASSLGILGVAIFLDGVFAAFYWRWWLGGLVRMLSYTLRH